MINKIKQIYNYFYNKLLWNKLRKKIIKENPEIKNNMMLPILCGISYALFILNKYVKKQSEISQKAFKKMKFQKCGIAKMHESDILYHPKETTIGVKGGAEILKQIRSEELNISTNFEVKNENS